MLAAIALCVWWVVCGAMSYRVSQAMWDSPFNKWPWWIHVIGGPAALIVVLAY